MKRWKVNPLEDGRFMAHHSNCPPRPHICFRGLLAGTLCGARETLPQAYRLAASRYRYESYELWRIREELAPPPGWASGPQRTER